MDSQSALDMYLDFLDSSSATEKEPLATPRIDQVLQNFKQQKSSASNESPVTRQPVAGSVECYESRLLQLESQLTDLLQRSKTPHKARTTAHSHYLGYVQSTANHLTDTDGSDTESPRTAVNTRTHIARPSTKASTHREAKQTLTQTSTKPARTSKRGSSGQQSYNRGPRHAANHTGSSPSPPPPHRVSSPSADRRTKTKLLMESKKREPAKKIAHTPTVQVLTKELDDERERRWKAEQAAGKLVEHVRDFQNKLADSHKSHELAVVRGVQLERDLSNEKATIGSLQAQVEQLQDAHDSSKSEVSELRKREEDQLKTLRSLEEALRKLETVRLQERTELESQTRESERLAFGHQREVELLRRSGRQLKLQLQQMQELLAVREREHHKAMEERKPLDSREVQDLISRQVDNERLRMEGIIEQHKQRLQEQQKAYKNLEDEFRMALRIEAGRYQELQAGYKAVSGAVESSRETAVSAVQKEQRAANMVAELTAMVKEQKGRITELDRAKKETVAQLKERVETLETEVAGKNKLDLKLQSLQEENARLSVQTTAQESVIEGLREERQLWGKELAYQGASLAQDRGRMEAQLDSLSKEASSLRGELQRGRDAVRIKEKQVEDQNQTIYKLKQDLSGKEAASQNRQLDWQREQQTLHLQLEQEEAACQDLQEKVSALVLRKEQLKEELAEAQESIEQWKAKYSKLKGRWDEKVSVISSLEENLTQLQTGFSEREQQLVQEKEQAFQHAKAAEARVKACDDAFRGQLEAKQRSHDNHVTKVMEQKNSELEQANQRVLAVEAEMRELLTEVAREKKSMESKFLKLSKAFQELQQDV